MNRTTIRLPEYAVDRQQAHDILRNIDSAYILRLDYRRTYFAGTSFSHELAILVDEMNPAVLEIIGGHERLRNLFIKYFDQPYVFVPSQ